MEGVPKFSFWITLPCHVCDGSVWNVPKIDASMSSGAQSEQGSTAFSRTALEEGMGTTAKLGAPAFRSAPFQPALPEQGEVVLGWSQPWACYKLM